jgi:gamma-glutamylcyclotransferase (GGCT)/AIG2-like uncharacterized protein YtfP
MNKLFVYGTLLRGEERDGMVLSLAMCPATTRGRLHLAPAGYPALQVDPGAGRISGELLTLDTPAVLTEVQTKDGSTEAWAYIMYEHQLRRAGCRPLAIKDWRALMRRG